ncbi:VC0807 family protein [Paenibacillus sp.]|uniref:VC0807 family protein n=1 Tax=Paenibacillus sp. TaxID=58172 RepID=UPI002D4148DD|nr:VC0807 family protein [Paenibacillus sp.]HZG55076.1 VC0807 family protein [Paenibacillus sp.]
MLFYAVLPYVIWMLTRHALSDYHALLLSTVPGFVYTIGRFAKEKSWNVTGVFLIVALLVGTTVDLLSGDAETMIMNNIRTLLVFGVFFVATMLAKRPMALYFFADTARVLGWLPEGRGRDALRDERLMPYFQALTLLFALRYVVIALVKLVMFSIHGVEGYGLLIWWRVALSWGFGGLILLASLYVAGRVRSRIGS